MRNRKREQRLIRVITLLDGAALGHDRERIMNLLHSARRACREGQGNVAEQCSVEALRHLRNARQSLRVPGAYAADAVAIDQAMNQLHSAGEKTLFSPLWRDPVFTEALCYLLIFTLLLTLVLHFVSWATD
ncbi:hypothetical protein LA637_p2077 (plasmid) [Erwinia amylovora LA637]|uniref:hypothetical protein n=1 Tax=Erwinia amylovora TaxID=552 RepID=UPI0003D61C48|nr:hypothetical protein [Erwinia amylovora]CDK23949.1 hypothetical protein LA637_p2077 [Erwinia amylovora LA637]